MSSVRVCLLSLTIATALGARSTPAQPRPAPLPLKQAVSFDLSAALDDRWRVIVEPLVIGRFTLGLSASYTTAIDRPSQPIIYESFGTTAPDRSFAPCFPGYGPCGPLPGSDPTYRASGLALHARWYPEALSRDGDRQAFAVYIGEFVSYEKRRISWPQWIYPPYYPPGDSLVIVIPGPPTPVPSLVQHLRGWEPGAELGARVMMGRHVLIDVGGTVRVATLDDPLARRRPGKTDARFVVAIGVGW